MSGRILTRRLSSVSPYEVDPLSWFTGPLVPLVFAAINLLYGATQAVLTWIQIGNPRLQFSGVILTTVGCLYVHLMTRPLRGGIGWGTGAVAMAI